MIDVAVAGLYDDSWSPAVPGDRHVVPPGGARIRIRTGGARLERIEVNDRPVALDAGDEDLILTFVPDDRGLVILRLMGGNGARLRYDFASPSGGRPSGEILRLLADFQRRLCDVACDGPLTARRLWDALGGELPLLPPRDTRTATADESHWQLSAIEVAMSHLLRVCDRPRTHLRVDEAVRPVGAVTRVGPAALRHLASHSEHWESQGIASLRPARLLAHVVDEDIALYENRFVKSLIDRLLAYTRRALSDVEGALGQAENALDWDRIIADFGDYRRHEMLATLVPRFDTADTQQTFTAFRRLKERLLRLHSLLAQCAAGRFYQQLRQCAPVRSPILPTNILRLDPHYRPLFDLWVLLDQGRAVEEDAIDGALPDDIQAAYAAYCQILILAGLRFAGFEPVEGSDQVVGKFEGEEFGCEGSFARGDWRIALESVADPGESCIILRFRRRRDSRHSVPRGLQVPPLPSDCEELLEIEGNDLVFHRPPSREELARIADLWRAGEQEARGRPKQERALQQKRALEWRRFVTDAAGAAREPDERNVAILPRLLDLGQEPSAAKHHSASLLDDALAFGRRHGARSTIVFAPSSLRSFPDTTPTSIIRRLATVGDAFAGDDALRWGAIQVGMLPISPVQLNSLLRLIRLVNTTTIGSDLAEGLCPPTCPSCMEAEGLSSNGCRRCGAQWGPSSCPSCNHRFGWLRQYAKDRPQGAAEMSHYGAWLEKLENLAGESAVVSFCEAPDAPPGIAPLCPRCGTCPRAPEYGNRCPRCRTG